MTRKQKGSWQDDPAVKKDEGFVRLALEMQVREQLASPTMRIANGEIEPLEVLKFNGAVERLLQRAIQEFSRTKATMGGREALLLWLKHFGTYLDFHLPQSARDLYSGPLTYLHTALSDLDHGFVRPCFEPPLFGDRPLGRPHDGYIEVNFRIACVLAADEIHEAGRSPQQKRSLISRSEADGRVLKRARNAAVAMGLSMGETTIDGWRRRIRKEPNDSDSLLAVGWRIKKSLADSMRPAHGSQYVVDWLLGRLTDPDYIA